MEGRRFLGVTLSVIGGLAMVGCSFTMNRDIPGDAPAWSGKRPRVAGLAPVVDELDACVQPAAAARAVDGVFTKKFGDGYRPIGSGGAAAQKLRLHVPPRAEQARLRRLGDALSARLAVRISSQARRAIHTARTSVGLIGYVWTMAAVGSIRYGTVRIQILDLHAGSVLHETVSGAPCPISIDQLEDTVGRAAGALETLEQRAWQKKGGRHVSHR